MESPDSRAGRCEVGTIGASTFRFGGGFVPSLHAGINVSDADRAIAHARCPAEYWIVGDVL